MMEILIVDDEAAIRDILFSVLQSEGYNVHTARNGEEGLALFLRHPMDMVITDLKMPGMSGLDFLAKILEIAPLTLAIVITGYGSIPDAVTAIKLGAIDFIEKPFALENIPKKIQEVFDRQNLPDTNSTRDRFGCLIGNSKAMQNLYSMIEKVALSDASILILGESGTGKDLVAQEIHEHSRRSKEPFVVVNCAALVPSLLEDELFGHVKGAFTGAQLSKRGRFELANNGTIFLDEIGEVPINLQSKLLRVLQEKAIERVGSTEKLSVNVRFLAATNRDLQTLLGDGQFREDLYYRLNVVSLKIPPLRERKSDISLIAQYYLDYYSQELNKKIKFSPETLVRLQNFSWPGNVRQLQNVIHRGAILVEGDTFTPSQLGPDLYDTGKKKLIEANLNMQNVSLLESPKPQSSPSGENMVEYLEDIEKNSILQALEACHWNQTKTALKLGLKRTALQYKMKKYDLKRPEH